MGDRLSEFHIQNFLVTKDLKRVNKFMGSFWGPAADDELLEK